MKDKNWFFGVVFSTLTILFLLAGSIIIIDPFLHFHLPLDFLGYPMENQRYTNDGILRNFDYNAIITGSSMTENFKSSEFDELFQCNSIKIPFSGASYKEINETLIRALNRDSEVEIILRCLDYYGLVVDKDSSRYDDFPEYMYDSNVLNDINYILNKDALLSAAKTLVYTMQGRVTPDFDTYSSWDSEYSFGKDSVMTLYNRGLKQLERGKPTVQEITTLRDNLEQNVIELAKENKDVVFYLFFSPYSICYWDSLYQSGEIEYQIEIEKMAIELLLEQDNIKLFSFFNNYDLICNLDNYRDIAHYSGKINSNILKYMSTGEYELTKENYMEYLDGNRTFYSNYDYDSIFE